MQKITFKKGSENKSEQGLSAVELLIAMAIFLVVMSSVYGILKIGNISRTTVNNRSENIKNVRLAINTIGREAINAGLGYNRIGGMVPDDFTSDNFQLPADEDEDADLLTAISAGNDVSESDLSKPGEKNDVMAFAFRDFQFNDGFPIVVNDVSVNGDTLILKTPDGACANCRPYDLFLIETGDGKQAVILSTDIINNNQIVLGGVTDPIGINYGKKDKQIKNAQKNVDKAQKEIEKIQKDIQKALKELNFQALTLAQQQLVTAQKVLTEALATLAALTGANNGVAGSLVKKCAPGQTSNCISYGSTSVVAKKIYLVSYSVAGDGTLIRTTYGNNTGAGAEEQVLRQPIANGVRSLKIQYLLADGTVTEDPAVANTQKERCNEIVQIEVTLVVEADASEGNPANSEPITLTSTFSTRNLKYDVY